MSKLIESTRVVFDGDNEAHVRVAFVDCEYFLDIPKHQFDAWEDDDFEDFIQSRAS